LLIENAKALVAQAHATEAIFALEAEIEILGIAAIRAVIRMEQPVDLRGLVDVIDQLPFQYPATIVHILVFGTAERIGAILRFFEEITVPASLAFGEIISRGVDAFRVEIRPMDRLFPQTGFEFMPGFFQTLLRVQTIFLQLLAVLLLGILDVLHAIFPVPQIPAHETVPDVPAIVYERAVHAVAHVESVPHIEGLEGINAIIGLLGIVTIAKVVRISAPDRPVGIRKILAGKQGTTKVAISRFPSVVAPVARRILGTELMATGSLFLQFVKLFEERPVGIVGHGRRLPFIRVPFRIFIDREWRSCGIQGNYPLSGKVAGSFIEFSERPEHEPMPGATPMTLRGNRHLYAFIKGLVVRKNDERLVAVSTSFRFPVHMSILPL
jgi:hypothetical protein